jgi:hypothetical protein
MFATVLRVLPPAAEYVYLSLSFCLSSTGITKFLKWWESQVSTSNQDFCLLGYDGL